MSQAPEYNRAADFAEDERLNAGGRTTVNSASLNAELDAAAESINALQHNQELIQRDDGKLRDAVVEPESLSSSTIAFLGGSSFNPRGDWSAGSSYVRLDMANVSGVNYIALSAHVASALFSTDLAAGKWQQFTGQQSASATSFSPSSGLSSDDVQTAIEEVQQNQLTNTRALLAFNYGAL